jgi:hypothetical protein
MRGGSKAYHLIAVAAPVGAVPVGELGVWAEVTSRRGEARLRVGNPMVAEMLRQDPGLARIFHRASPVRDRPLFAQALSERIAARSAAEGTIDAAARGKRLADLLLPDVLLFDPARPVGYTFAGQNGRHPADHVAGIVDTVLAGVVTARVPAEGPFKMTNHFPYFETVATS